MQLKNLIQRAQQGDIKAFEELIKIYQDAVFGAAITKIRNFHDAEDIAQEAFIIAYQELPRLREINKFPGWLRRITITATGRFFRSRKITHQDLSATKDIPSNRPEPGDLAEKKDLKETIMREIDALSEKNRMAATLYFINGYSHNEISEFLEVPITTVKSRIHESRQILKRRLITMAKEVLHQNKPGKEFIEKLMEKINDRYI